MKCMKIHAEVNFQSWLIVTANKQIQLWKKGKSSFQKKKKKKLDLGPSLKKLQ